MSEKIYRVLLNEIEIGTTRLEDADPSMGVVSGKISFSIAKKPFDLFFDHCQSHRIAVNEADPSLGFIDTQVMPQLHVIRNDGVEICGIGNHITGFREDGYQVTILGIPYPFYGDEFPHHRLAYDERWKRE